MVRNKYTSTVHLYTWGEIKDYYEKHSSADTAKHFDFSVCTLLRLCKRNNYSKPKDLVYAQIDYSKVKSKEFQEEKKLNNIKRWGVSTNLLLDETRKKAHSKEVIEKQAEKRKEFYATVGDEYWVRRNAKSAETKELRYGSKNYNNPIKNYETNVKNHNGKHCTGVRRYVYKGEYFDSFPELAYYVYNIDNCMQIERCPETFEFEFNSKIYKYEVDFRCNGDLIEIKGDHFFKDGKMICPFDRSQDNLYEAKYKCGLANGVKFYTAKEYMKYIDYFNSKYNAEDFLCRKQ